VFGSGRACRNSWDFRTAVISATPAPGAKPSADLAPRPGRRLAAPGVAPAAVPAAAPGAAQAAGHSRPV